MIVYYFFNPFVTIKKPIYIFLIIKLYTEHVYTSIYNSTLEKNKCFYMHSLIVTKELIITYFYVVLKRKVFGILNTIC